MAEVFYSVPRVIWENNLVSEKNCCDPIKL